MGNIQYSRIVESCLNLAKDHLHSIQGGTAVTKQGSGFGDLQNDTEIKADEELGKFIEETLSISEGISHVEVEGRVTYENSMFSGKDRLTAYVDPLDGSLSYKLGALVSHVHIHPFPYSGVITLAQGNKPKFKDIVAAGIIDYRTGDLFSAERDRPTTLNGQEVKTLSTEHFGLTDQIVIGEFYYDKNRQMLARIFEGQNGYLRSFGSAAMEMAYVAGGFVSAYICSTQKQHELIAAYLLVKNAGGWVSDFDGNPLDDVPVIFNSKTPVILAANERVGKEIVGRIRHLS